MNQVKVGFFSLSRPSPTGDDRPYLRWHQMDHMPEQYQLPGMVLGQRWASTPACRAARVAEYEDWSLVEHVVCYLMGTPVDQTLDDFLTLGRHLAERGRFPYALPSQFRGGLRLLETHVAPRVLVSAEVIPFRPHTGVFLIVEEPTDLSAQDAYRQRFHTEVIPALVAVAGVAGVWSYATSPAIWRSMFTQGNYRITVCYLDDDVAAVAKRLAPILERTWATAPVRPLLAAPFESLVITAIDRFGPCPA